MKKIIIILMLLAAFLYGCTPVVDDPTVPTEPTYEAFEYTYYEDSLYPTADEVGKDYYFLCPKFDVTLTTAGTVDTLSIPLISRTEIDTTQMKVVLPLENVEYEVFYSTDWAGMGASSLEYHTYLCYTDDRDWSTILADDRRAQWLLSRIQADEYGRYLLEDDGRFLGFTHEENDWINEYSDKEVILNTALSEMKREDYPGSLPGFYAYTITINFLYSGGEEDTMSYMDVSWPGVSFRQDCGEIRFRDIEIPKSHDYKGALSDCSYGQMGGTLAASGMALGTQAIEFKAGTSIVLEEISLEYGDGVITRIDLQVGTLTSEGYVYMDLEWDGKSPVPVNALQHVIIDITYTDPQLASLVVLDKEVWNLKYSKDGEQYNRVFLQRPSRQYNYFTLAAVYFDGMDLRSYYKDYYNQRWGAQYFR